MKNVLEYKGYKARIDFEPEDGVLAGRILGIDDVVGFHGESVPEVTEAFHEALDDYLETCEAIGKEPDKSYSGQLSVRISPDAHRNVSMVAAEEGISVNKLIERMFTDKKLSPKKQKARSSSSGVYYKRVVKSGGLTRMSSSGRMMRQDKMSKISSKKPRRA